VLTLIQAHPDTDQDVVQVGIHSLASEAWVDFGAVTVLLWRKQRSQMLIAFQHCASAATISLQLLENVTVKIS